MPRTPRPTWIIARRQFGHRIARLRVDLGLTVDGLAERAGLDRKVVLRAAHATTSAGVDLLLMIAAGLDLSLSELVADDPPPG